MAYQMHHQKMGPPSKPRQKRPNPNGTPTIPTYHHRPTTISNREGISRHIQYFSQIAAGRRTLCHPPPKVWNQLHRDQHNWRTTIPPPPPPPPKKERTPTPPLPQKHDRNLCQRINRKQRKLDALAEGNNTRTSYNWRISPPPSSSEATKPAPPSTHLSPPSPTNATASTDSK